MNILRFYTKRRIRRDSVPKCRYARFPTLLGRFVMPTDWKNSAILRHLYIDDRLYEPETVAYLREHVKSGDVVLDVGANFGYYTVLFSKWVQHGIVHAFEPVPENYGILKLNTYSRPNVVLHKKAISNKVSSRWFYKNRSYGGHGLIPKTLMNGRFLVETIPLDDYNFRRVDWVKIDVEGHEGEVLDGMRDVIRRNPRIRLIIEFMPERGLNDAFYDVLSDFQFKGLDGNVLAYREEG